MGARAARPSGTAAGATGRRRQRRLRARADAEGGAPRAAAVPRRLCLAAAGAAVLAPPARAGIIPPQQLHNRYFIIRAGERSVLRSRSRALGLDHRAACERTRASAPVAPRLTQSHASQLHRRW